LQEEVALKAALSILLKNEKIVSSKGLKEHTEALFPIFDGSKWSFPSNCPQEISLSDCESRFDSPLFYFISFIFVLEYIFFNRILKNKIYKILSNYPFKIFPIFSWR
jgi:hypothetical protein